MARRLRCPVCRSKRWHRDGLSGAVVCEEGHLLAGYVQETTETQEGPSQHTQTTRRVRKNRTRKQRPPTNDHFHGDREKWLLWQAMQLILREQLRVLIDEGGWPVQLEAVTRDLWSLLVASSGDRGVPPAPRDYHLDDEPAASYSGPRKGDRYNRAGRKPYGTRGGSKKNEKEDDEEEEDPEEEDDDRGEDGGGDGSDHQGTLSASDGERGAVAGEGEPQSSDEDSDADSYFSEDQDADDERAPPTNKRRSRKPSPVVSRLGVPSSPGHGPGGLDGTDATTAGLRSFAGRGGGRARYPSHKRRRVAPPPARSDDPRDHPRLEYTLLVIYLACVTLKLPIMLGDLFRLADTYQILYLDAVLHLPADMQAHLTKRSRDLLSPTSTPHLYSHNISFERLSPDDAGTVQATLARLVTKAYHLALALLSYLPSPPPPPASFHLPDSLQLSHVHVASGTTTTTSTGSGWPRHRTGSQDWRVALPEIKLATVVVVLCRLMWDLDLEGGGPAAAEEEEERGLEDSNRASTTSAAGATKPSGAGGIVENLPSCAAWLDAIESLARLEQPGDPSPLWTQEVVDMRDDEIDDYLDFFESKIVSQEKVPSRMDHISRFFPPPHDEDMPENKQTVAPHDYLDKAAAIITELRHGTATTAVPAGSNGTADLDAATLSSVFSAASGRQSSSFSTSDLPGPLSRLLCVLASRLTPLPSSLRINLRGPAPSHETTGIANLLPFIDQVERALVVGADASPDAEQYTPRRERDPLPPREVKRRAEQERQERTKQEKERRRAVDRLRGVPPSVPLPQSEVAVGESSAIVRVRLEDPYGREIKMARYRARIVKSSKEVIDSEQEDDDDDDEMEVEPAGGMAEVAPLAGGTTPGAEADLDLGG
ncbi:hypothetical protein B0A53_01847 [Rhodotorula sp. CCFEE 5036]|nr:hypothetical protein B0A53_01847 [Rhodotorula sp. CCFEE 5036]